MAAVFPHWKGRLGGRTSDQCGSSFSQQLTPTNRRALLLLAVVVCWIPGGKSWAGIKLWPALEIERDVGLQTREAKILGPLIHLRERPSERWFALRPLALYHSAGTGEQTRRRLWILYPLISASQEPGSRSVSLLGGVVSYRATSSGENRLSHLRFRMLPLVFLDWDSKDGLNLSLVPIYANLRNQFGASEVKMLMFPFYLRLTSNLVDRRYYFFPFFGTAAGHGSSGYRLWPIYGKRKLGMDQESGFVAWPFYVWQYERRGKDVEKRKMLFPFRTSIEGSSRSSRAYGFTLFTHTRDYATERESFGFPWPLSVYERDLASGETLTLRVFPFYQRKRLPDGGSNFVAWPFFRHKFADAEGVHYFRKDVLLALYRQEEEWEEKTSRRRRLRSLFPLYRSWSEPGVASAGAPALIDSLMPANPIILDLYAPLWQLWNYKSIDGEAGWSILWGAVTRKKDETRYPWHWR